MEPAPKDLAWTETERMRRRLDEISLASLVSPTHYRCSRSEPSPRAEPMCLDCHSANESTHGSSIVDNSRSQGRLLPSPGGRRTAAPDAGKVRTRPVYTEEQKFFIMYARIILDKSWVDIEGQFAANFAHRSKDGITSMYYRIRKNWCARPYHTLLSLDADRSCCHRGLKDILKTGPDSYLEDKQTVLERASYFSEEFLVGIGCHL